MDARAVNCWYISICGSMVASQLVCLTLDQTVRVQALLICGIVFCSWARHFTPSAPLTTQGQIVQKVDNTVQQIAYRVCFVNTYSIQWKKNDLSSGQRYPAFEQTAPGVQMSAGKFNPLRVSNPI